MKEIYERILAILVIAGFVIMAYPVFEPGNLLAQTASDEVQVNLTVTSGITIDSPTDATMAPNLGVAQNTSTGSTTWTVVTNDTDGYTLTVQSSTTPAMQSSQDSFTDYTEASAGTPETWSVSNAYEFGYGAFGGDVSDGTWGAGSACNNGGSGNIPSDINYEGFSTTPRQIASNASETTQAGTSSTVCYAAEQETVFAPSGAYSATIIATATVQ